MNHHSLGIPVWQLNVPIQEGKAPSKHTWVDEHLIVPQLGHRPYLRRLSWDQLLILPYQEPDTIRSHHRPFNLFRREDTIGCEPHSLLGYALDILHKPI